jgi:hypothetical protein
VTTRPVRTRSASNSATPDLVGLLPDRALRDDHAQLLADRAQQMLRRDRVGPTPPDRLAVDRQRRQLRPSAEHVQHRRSPAAHDPLEGVGLQIPEDPMQRRHAEGPPAREAQSLNNATQARHRIGPSGWRLPRAFRGSGTSAKYSLKGRTSPTAIDPLPLIDSRLHSPSLSDFEKAVGRGAGE